MNVSAKRRAKNSVVKHKLSFERKIWGPIYSLSRRSELANCFWDDSSKGFHLILTYAVNLNLFLIFRIILKFQESDKLVTPAKKTREINTDGSNSNGKDGLAYACLLKNELLGAGIEDMKVSLLNSLSVVFFFV